MRALLITCFLCFTVVTYAQTDTTQTQGPDSLMNSTGLTFTANELDDQIDDQSFSGILNSNQDVYMRNAGYNFSAGRFRIRGMNSSNFHVLINGVPMNDPEIGFAIWANWGGLNDITRYPETGAGVAASDYSFGGLQGYSNINMRASSKRAGTRISYSSANRSYRNRAMLTHSTGLMDDGLAISASISARWSDEGYIQGTSYSNMGYFLSIEKVLNDRHTIGVIGFGSPSLRGRSSLSTNETYELRDDNYYNPYWGYQDGEKRNSRMRGSHKPIAMAWHRFKLNENTSFQTSLYTQFGSYYQTRLDWTDSNDPRPDYYRNLPSWLEYSGEPEGIAALQDSWANDPSFYQLDWDSFYNANSKNLHTVNNVDGIEGNSHQGFRSKYIVEEAHADPFMLGINSTVTHKLSETRRIHGGINVYSYTSDNYKVINDLLGGEYWLDVNRFAAGLLPGSQGAQNDLDNPNRIVGLDERYGYNYKMERRNLDLFAQYSEELEVIDYYVGVQLNSQSFWREGQFRNELFPDNSKGESEHSSFTTGGVKAGLTYKLSGRHFLSANTTVSSRAPLIRNSFLSPRTRNSVVNDITAEKLSSVDINYLVRFPRLKLRLTGYSAAIKDQVQIFTFYSEGSNDLINLVTSGVDHSYQGLELGFEANATSTLTISGALGHGQHLYTSRPLVTRVIDETNTPEASELSYLENYRLGRTPQAAANLGFIYRDPHFWFGGFNYSYFANIYVDPLSTRRTESVVDGLVTSDPQWSSILDQTKLENSGALNFFAGKSWRFDRKYYLLVTANVSNILNNTDFNTGGYEQGRPTAANLDLFDNKYGYMYGRTYFAMVRFSF